MGDEEGRKMQPHLPHLCAVRRSCFSIALRNHLGRLSEVYDPKLQRQISNLPQVFSYFALILMARIIDTPSVKGELEVLI